MAEVPGTQLRPITRATHGARIFWEDGGTREYISVDGIVALEDTLSSVVTQFPRDVGSPLAEHIIHFPESLKLEIIQTQRPLDELDGDALLEYPKQTIELEIPPTRFEPKGLLYLTLAAENAIGDAVGALGSLVGIEPKGPKPVQIEVFKPPYTKDRINELYDKINSARLAAREINLQWLGRVWSNLAFTQVIYSRKAGSEKGRFAVVLEEATTVSTATASLPDPAEARLKAGVSGGSKPGTVASAAEKASAAASAEKSLAAAMWDGVR